MGGLGRGAAASPYRSGRALLQIRADQVGWLPVAIAERGLSLRGGVQAPYLRLLGLATRFAALGLLVMTGVIQLVVPDGWANFHLPWAALAIAIIALGPGGLSLDHLIGRLRHPRIPRGAA